MDKTNPPRSFGVFKPVGHTVIAFPTAAAMEAAASSLLSQGFTASDLVRYTPAEMKAQVEADLLTASPLAAVGQEINLVKAHRTLAENGCSFLVVYAPHDALAQRVDAAVHAMQATSAQRYGSFLIEELVDLPAGATQVFESPDRGLDVGATGATRR